MESEETEARPMRTGPSIAGAIAAGIGAGGMAWFAAELAAAMPGAESTDALMTALLTAVALCGALLCGYLCIIWSIATAALVIGPASMLGRALVGALRLLAPQLARRVTTGALVAASATTLAVAPALAADSPAPALDLSEVSIAEHHAPSPLQHEQHEQREQIREDTPSPDASDARSELSTERSAADDAQSSDAAEDDGQDPSAASDQDELPDLGWEGSPAPAPATDPAPAPATHPDASDDPSAPSRTLTVREGDTLWSLTESLLESEATAQDPQDVAHHWPELYAANADVIGEDPQLIHPGQVLAVPGSLSPDPLSPGADSPAADSPKENS